MSTAVVSWNGFISNSYALSSGVTQDGCLSPVLFAKYVDCIITSLQNRGFGCHIGLQSMAIIMYADDLILISGSITDLQAMIDACITEFDNLDLSINAKKSVCLRIGKLYKSTCSSVCINGASMPWSDQITYLGLTIKASVKIMFDFKQNRTKFYRAFNSLYCKISNANEYLIVSLVKSFCIPLVMYSLNALDLNVTSLNSLDNLMFNVFGKIFKTFDKNILKSCMLHLDCLQLYFEYRKRKILFLSTLHKIENECLKTWLSISGANNLRNTCVKHNVRSYGPSCIKRDIWRDFALSIL